MEWFFKHYLNNLEESKICNPKIYPYYYNNFKELPKTLVICAECDPLHDEGFFYAKKCYENSVNIKYYEFQGLIHGFIRYIQRGKCGLRYYL